MPPLSNVAPDG